MISWSNDLLIGVPTIDTQHWELYELCQQLTLAAASADPLPNTERALAFLTRYLDEHFRDEEQLMQSLDYPGFHAHRDSHARFRTQLAPMLARAARDIEIARKVSNALTAWFEKHILGQDLELARFVTERGFDPAWRPRPNTNFSQTVLPEQDNDAKTEPASL